ncbi:MAG: glycosyltransferase family 39 protein [Leptolyngbyaceae cyanobacterium]
MLKDKLRSPWFWLIAIFLLVGISFRWLNLGSKIFWYDEVFTALRVTGHIGAEVREQVFTGEPIAAATLLQYQTFSPDSTLGDTLRSLADHPEHPPLFYLLCWGWVKIFGSSMAAFRGVSALASTLTFLALPWLAWELFLSVEAIVIAPVLFAFSPVHLLYAQEARQYALWTLLIVLATAAMKRAVRQKRWSVWLIYAVFLGLMFNTSVLSLFVVMAHGVYALLINRRQWRTMAVAVGLAGMMFVPWLGVMWINSQRWQSATSWTTQVVYPIDALIKLWGLHFSSVFFDPNLPLDHPYSWGVPPLILVLLIGLSWGIWQSFARDSSLLLLALIWVPTACLIGGDWIRDSVLSKNTRYFMPALIGFLVAVAGWLSRQYQQRRQWAIVGVATVVGLGLASSIAIVQAPTWWNKSLGYYNREIAAAISRFEQPVILIQAHGTTLGDAISLSYYLPPQTPFVLTVEPEIPQVPNVAKTVLLFQPTEAVFNSFACMPEAIPVPAGLFQVPCVSSDRRGQNDP